MFATLLGYAYSERGIELMTTDLKSRALECVYAAIDEANIDRVAEEPPLEKSPSTPIHGGDSGLDSLGLVNFVVAVEENVEREFGAQIMLADDRSLSREPSPLRSVGALTDYIEELLREEG